ncbi:MAG TPA: hypothetical protein VFI39_06660 [Gemmatimonadales bacterium]|nr:hypothetical protein [Gemmatimonadales bacterium]
MRGRWLKPEFFKDRKVAALGPVPALVYQALWVLADDVGVAPCDPDRIRGELFYLWSAVGVPEITGALRELYGVGRLQFFHKSDDWFALIPTFLEHQTIHKPSKFRNLPSMKGLTPSVPEWCGTSDAPVRHSPYPIHKTLDTNILDTKGDLEGKHFPPEGGNASPKREPGPVAVKALVRELTTALSVLPDRTGV